MWLAAAGLQDRFLSAPWPRRLSRSDVRRSKRLRHARFGICCAQPSPASLCPCQAVSCPPPAVIIRTSGSNSSTGNTDTILVSDPSLPILSPLPFLGQYVVCRHVCAHLGQRLLCRRSFHVSGTPPFISATYVLLFSLYGPGRKNQSISKTSLGATYTAFARLQHGCCRVIITPWGHASALSL